MLNFLVVETDVEVKGKRFIAFKFDSPHDVQVARRVIETIDRKRIVSVINVKSIDEFWKSQEHRVRFLQTTNNRFTHHI